VTEKEKAASESMTLGLVDILQMITLDPVVETGSVPRTSTLLV
jgi:hypothetical protein